MNRQKWVLVRGNGKYSIGEFDGTALTEETEQLPCDVGPNFYATMSWGNITGARKFEELPKEAQQYVKRIEQLVGAPVKMVSVGPERAATMIR